MSDTDGRSSVRMNISKRALSLLVLFAILLVTPPSAFALRCGTNIVDVGDAKIDVLRKCGKPDLVDEWEEEDYYRSSPEIDRLGETKKRTVRVFVEQWTYNFGATRLIYYLIFKNGVLSEIRTGEYGF